MVVDKRNSWNFTYILPPKHPDNEPKLIIPNLLQMGRSESPHFFCSAKETAWNLADKYYRNRTKMAPRQDKQNSPKYWLDQHCAQELWQRQITPSLTYSLYQQFHSNDTMNQHWQTHRPDTLHPHRNNWHLSPTWSLQLHYWTTNLKKETQQGRCVENTKKILVGY